MSLQTTAQFNASTGANVNVHIAKKLLMLAHKDVIFQQLGEKAKMPAGEGKTFQFNRYERLALPKVPLTEGSPGSSTNMSLSIVQATADEWGAWVELSNVVQLTVAHPLLQVATMLLAVQAAELVDREIINILLASTSVTYGGAATSASGLATASTDSFSDTVAQKVVKRLKTRGAMRYDGAKYVGVVDPAMEQDLTGGSSTSAFIFAAAYADGTRLFNGEIGTWRGVRWMVSNFIPTSTGVAAETYATPAGGSFAAANYRVTTAYYDAQTGFLVQLSQNANVAFAAADKLTYTTPNNSSYLYKVFVGLAGGAAVDVMYQASETVALFGLLSPNVAYEFLAPPVAGTAIAGSEIPGTAKVVHFGWVMGKESFCSVDLENLKTFISLPQATTDNPLLQVRTVGYRLMFKPVIQNNNFLEKIEVLSQYE